MSPWHGEQLLSEHPWTSLLSDQEQGNHCGSGEGAEKPTKLVRYYKELLLPPLFLPYHPGENANRKKHFHFHLRPQSLFHPTVCSDVRGWGWVG